MPLCFYIFPFDFVDAMHIRGDTLAIYQTHTHKYATFGTSIIIIISHYEWIKICGMAIDVRQT